MCKCKIRYLFPAFPTNFFIPTYPHSIFPFSACDSCPNYFPAWTYLLRKYPASIHEVKSKHFPAWLGGEIILNLLPAWLVSIWHRVFPRFTQPVLAIFYPACDVDNKWSSTCRSIIRPCNFSRLQLSFKKGIKFPLALTTKKAWIFPRLHFQI